VSPRQDDIKKISVDIQKEFCEECSLALRRFVGKMNGVHSIDVAEGRIVITYDDTKLTKENVLKITRDSIEKLGYKMSE